MGHMGESSLVASQLEAMALCAPIIITLVVIWRTVLAWCHALTNEHVLRTLFTGSIEGCFRFNAKLIGV